MGLDYAECITCKFGRDELVKKIPQDTFKKYTGISVLNSQEAFIFKNGEDTTEQPLKQGKYPIDHTNDGKFKKILSIIMGEEYHDVYSIYFINKQASISASWETPIPHVQDPIYKFAVNIFAAGKYSGSIIDSRKFLNMVIGSSVEVYTKVMMTEQIKGFLDRNIKGLVLNWMIERRIGTMEIRRYLNDISDIFEERMATYLKPYGIALNEFSVSSLEPNDNNKSLDTVFTAETERMRENIDGPIRDKKMMYEMMREQNQNAGYNEPGGIGSGQVDFGIMGESLPLSQQSTLPIFPAGYFDNNDGVIPPRPKVNLSEGEQVCPNCNKKLIPGDFFCSQCGFELYPLCTKCGAELTFKNKFCPKCGEERGSGIHGNQ